MGIETSERLCNHHPAGVQNTNGHNPEESLDFSRIWTRNFQKFVPKEIIPWFYKES